MIWAAFNLAFLAFLRCSEFTCPGVRNFRPHFDLSTDCIAFHPNPAHPQRMSVYLKSYKTDIYRQGHFLIIAHTSSPLCAVAAIQEYFLLARCNQGLCSISNQAVTLPVVSYRTCLGTAHRLLASPIKVLRAIVFVLVLHALFWLGGCIALHASVAVKSAQQLPPSLWFALPLISPATDTLFRSSSTYCIAFSS